ncbi:MAG: recombinase family protein, partial [Propionibacteriales bacterium]|nr:recombinase family protein [Propionibacteriales bacterium]
MTTAAVYARISQDDGFELGVTRQIEDCTREAERRGWELTETYVDNDKSASNGRARPAYERLLTDIRHRRIDGLVVWDVDRLTRTPRELEDIIDLAVKSGLQLANVGGDIDLATEDGRMMARIKGTVARREVEQSSKRIRRKFDERASAGLPHGMTAYGYRRQIVTDDKGRRIDAKDVLVETEASVIRNTAERLLTGESLRSVVSALNATGSRSPRGKPWSSTTLRQIMLRDRNAGLRRHRGVVVGKGRWEPILDEGTHTRVVSLLTDPSRRSQKGSTRRHLLSGIARCGLCDSGDMRVLSAAVSKAGKSTPAKYQCRCCFRVARKQSVVDAFVEAVVVARLQRPDALAALATGRPARATELQKLIDELTARKQVAADQFARGTLD